MTTSKTTNGKTNGDGSTQPPIIQSSAPSDPNNFDQSDRDEILQLIALLRDKLPPLSDLTAEERRSLPGMGDKNRIFAGKVLEVILQNPDFLPRSFDIDGYQRNLSTFDYLTTIAMALTQLLDLVNATTIAIGSDTYEEALVAYRYAKASGQGASLEAMMAELKQRFSQQGKKKKDTDTDKPEA
jgi:hypothetical protein